MVSTSTHRSRRVTEPPSAQRHAPRRAVPAQAAGVCDAAVYRTGGRAGGRSRGVQCPRGARWHRLNPLLPVGRVGGCGVMSLRCRLRRVRVTHLAVRLPGPERQGVYPPSKLCAIAFVAGTRPQRDGYEMARPQAAGAYPWTRAQRGATMAPRRRRAGDDMADQNPTFESTFEKVLLPAIVGLVLGALGVWVGALVSTLLWTRRWLNASLPETVGVVINPSHWSASPERAWPSDAVLAPVGAYWTFVVLACAGLGYLARALHKKRSKDPKIVDRVRLGTSTKSTFAKLSDLATIAVPGPTYARFILGLAHDPSGQDETPAKRLKDRVAAPTEQLVATEHRRLAPAKPPRGESEHPRQGDIGSVAVIGPSRSGKTVNVVSGILDWMGPAILSSVKGDLLDATLRHRQTVGDVRVFDPMGIISEVHGLNAGWSPLHGIRSLEEAQQQSQSLQDAAPTGGAENSQFFVNLAGQLLAPMIWVAAKSEMTMTDLVRWVKIQDSTQKPGAGNQSSPQEIRRALMHIQRTTDPGILGEAKRATEALTSVWENDERTRGNIYTTASMMLRAWESPGVMAADADTTQIDLEWLLDDTAGYNTLYLCAPLEDQDRLGVVFGGLLGSLTNDLYKRGAGAKPLSPPLLLVMDEAANTPNQKLPGIVSTCAGLGMLLVTVWQSMAQIQNAYGQRAGDVVTNHNTKLFYAGASDENTLNYVSALVGAEEVFTMQQRTDDDKQQGKTVSMSELMPKDLLRRAPPGTALMIHGTLPPIELRSRQWWKDKRLKALADGAGPDWTPGQEPSNPDASSNGSSPKRSDSGPGSGATPSNGEQATPGGWLGRLVAGKDDHFDSVLAAGTVPAPTDTPPVGEASDEPHGSDDVWDRAMPDEADPFTVDHDLRPDGEWSDDAAEAPAASTRSAHPDMEHYPDHANTDTDDGADPSHRTIEARTEEAIRARIEEAHRGRLASDDYRPGAPQHPLSAGPRLRPPTPPSDDDNDDMAMNDGEPRFSEHRDERDGDMVRGQPKAPDSYPEAPERGMPSDHRASYDPRRGLPPRPPTDDADLVDTDGERWEERRRAAFDRARQRQRPPYPDDIDRHHREEHDAEIDAARRRPPAPPSSDDRGDLDTIDERPYEAPDQRLGRPSARPPHAHPDDDYRRRRHEQREPYDPNRRRPPEPSDDESLAALHERRRLAIQRHRDEQEPPTRPVADDSPGRRDMVRRAQPAPTPEAALLDDSEHMATPDDARLAPRAAGADPTDRTTHDEPPAGPQDQPPVPSAVPPFNVPAGPGDAPSSTPRIVGGAARVKRIADDDDDDDDGGGPAFRDGGDTHAVRMQHASVQSKAEGAAPSVAPQAAAERRRRMAERFPLESLE